MAESSDEWEEEEQYVLVELKGLLEIDDLKDCTTENSFVWGADTPNPVLKLSRYVFSGEYDDTLGTAVLFEETEKNGKMHLKYNCHTTRKLETVRSHLEPIVNKNTAPEDTSEIAASTKKKVQAQEGTGKEDLNHSSVKD